MSHSELEQILDSILDSLPVIKKKMLQISGEGIHCEHKFTFPYWHALHIIKQFEPVTVSQLSTILLISTPNVTKLLDDLEQEKIIKRTKDSHDKRKVYISITKSGQKTFESHKNEIKDNMRKYLSNLSNEELKRFARAFTDVHDILEKIQPSPDVK